jgi:hypothetical protein
MKAFRFAFLAALCGAHPAAATPAGDIAGTWECRLPGVQYRGKPPILYVADSGGDPSQVTIEVDGFAREIYGRSEISPDQGGWWKVKPAQGQEFMIRPETGAKLRTPAMGLRLTDSKGDYQCLRLPPPGVQSPSPSEAPSVQQPGAQSTPPSEAQSVPPSDTQNEGPAVKKVE